MKAKRLVKSLLMLLVAALVFAGCTKDEKQPQKTVGKRVKIGAKKAESTSAITKTTYEWNASSKSLNVKWAEGDGLSVTYYDSDLEMDNANNFDLEDGAGSTSGTFVSPSNEMCMIDPDCVEKLFVYYPKGTRNRVMTTGEYDISYDISSQAGTLEELGKYDLMKGVALTEESFDYDEETLFKVALKSYVSILRIPAGTLVIPTYENNSSEANITLSLSGAAMASKVVYKGEKETFSGNVVTASATVKNGKLTDDLYLTFIGREDATEYKAYEYKVITSVTGDDSNTFEAVLTKRPASEGRKPFDDGVVYTLTKLSLGQTGSANYTLRYLTFEDSDYKGDDPDMIWSARIDSEEYGGPLLYENGGYYWYDEHNTELFSEQPFTEFWSGGEAISNYILTDFAEAGFMRQLSVPIDNNGRGGHNGSSNFAVHSGYEGYASPKNYPEISFADGKARIIDHMWVAPTTYVLNSALYGDGFANPLLDEGTFFKIVAIGKVNGVETARAEYYLAKDGKIVKDWKKWNLVSLGKVDAISFSLEGSDSGEWGLNTPGYFAYDDIAVRFE